MKLAVQQTYEDLLSSLTGMYVFTSLVCTWYQMYLNAVALVLSYNIMSPTYTVMVNEDSIMRWIEVDKAVLLSHATSASSLSRNDWRTTYYQLLHMYYNCTR